MGHRERSDSGQFVETVTLENVLDVFNQVRGPVITSSDVSDELECTTEAARQKLTRLYDQGKVDKRKTGRTVVYWHTDQQSGHSTPVEQSPTERDVSPEPIEEPRENELAGRETAPTDLDEILEGWPPRAESKREQRKQAGLAALEYLQEKGEAKATDFKEDVEPMAPVDGQSTDTWWKKAARPAIKRAQDTGVIEFHNGTKVYSWISEP